MEETDNQLQKPVNEWVIKPAHTKEGHFYDVDETLMPSVTTVLKVLDKSGPLMGWAVKMTAAKTVELFARHVDLHGNVNIPFTKVQEIADDAKKNYRQAQQEASDVGTKGHALVEAVMLGKPSDETVYDERLVNGLRAFAAWKDANKVVPYRVEAYLASKKYGFAGTCDFMGSVNGSMVIGDWKFATGIYDEYKYQVAAYAAAAEEMTGKKFKGAYILRFDKKTGEFNPEKDCVYVSRSECLKYFKAFKFLLAYWKSAKLLSK